MDPETGDRAATTLKSPPPPAEARGGLGSTAASTRPRGRLVSGFDRWAQPALAVAIIVGLGVVAYELGTRPRREALDAVPDTLRALLATLVLFGVGGFGVVRLCLPEALRPHEPLWIVPTGACAVGLAMTLLGFAAVPYPISLVAVLVAGAGLGIYSLRKRGWPQSRWPELGFPSLLALVVCGAALIPMVMKLHYAAPVGLGSDAHMAAGTANFLKHSYPTGVDIAQPIQRMPPLWKSKFPIYYAFAGVSSLSGLDTWQVLTPLAAALLGLAAAGLYLVIRDVFGAPQSVAVAAMALAGLDRMALHTGLNPYLNQTWGYFAMPFTLVLGWWVVQPGLGRRARQTTFLLLAVFGLVLVFAYPLAAPIPLVPLVVFAWGEHRRRISRGERVFRLRDLYRGRRSLLWIIPLIAVLAVPIEAVIAKSIGAAGVLLPGHSLINWGGDLLTFIPFNFFLSLPASTIGTVLAVVLSGLAAWGLWGQPAALAWGLGGLLAIGVLLAIYFRQRTYGYYFHFKLLAFVGPLLLAIAVVGAGKLARAGFAIIAVFAATTTIGAIDELKATGFQLPRATIQLRGWSRTLPAGASIRLDMPPSNQLWAAYFLAARPLCSQLPLLRTDYPHVTVSRKADYIVATLDRVEPPDAIGRPLRQNAGYRLYRENPAVPGPSFCSRIRQDRLFSGVAYGS